MSDVDRWAANFKKLTDAYARSPEQVATATARRYVTGIRSEIGAVTSGGKLRGVGRRGARVGVRSDVRNEGTRAIANVQATGPLHLIERDTTAHTIPRTQSSRRLRTASGRLSHKRETTGRTLSGRTFLGSAARGFAAVGPVTHPGTKGKHPFERGVRRSEQDARTAAWLEVGKALKQVYR